MSSIPRKKQIELLQQLFMMDVWNEFLLPEYKEASEILLHALKSTKDPDQRTHLAGQLVGLDAIINLPTVLASLQEAEAQELAAAGEMPSTETV